MGLCIVGGLGVEELRGDESNLWQANMTESRMCTRDVRTL